MTEVNREKPTSGVADADTRARALSESLRSSRAEKRMGRLFKPPNGQSEADQHHSEASERTFKTAPHSRLVMGNQDRTVSDQGHSLGIARESSAEQTAHVQHAQHAPQTQNTQSTQNTQQPPHPHHPHTNTPSPLPVMKTRARGRVNTLSTLVETTPTKSLPLSELVVLAKKFKLFYDHLLKTTAMLNTGVSVKFKSHAVFLATLESAEKTPTTEDSAATRLATSIVQCMSDLRIFIQNLKLTLIPMATAGLSETLKSAYFAIFALFTEIVTIAKFIVPLAKPLKKTRKVGKRAAKASQRQAALLQRKNSQTIQPVAPSLSSSSSHLSFSAQQRSRSKSSLSQRQNPAPLPTQKPPQQYPPSKLKPSLSLNRMPAPNPNVSTQSLPVRQTTSRSSSGTVRQDSDASMFNVAQEQLVGDERLVESINNTIQSAQVVFSQVNSAISKSAISTAQAQNGDGPEETLDGIAQKVRDLTSNCMNSMEKTRRLKMALHSFKQRSQNATADELYQNLYETTNMFLKSIISILAATKGAIEDIPALNDVRSSLSILTRATKELTIKLETSSLKNSVVSNNPSNAVEQPPLSSIPSMSTFHGNGPLSAVIQPSNMSFDVGNHPMSAGVVNNFPGGGMPRRQSTRIVSATSAQPPRIQRQDVLETKGSIDSMQQHIKSLQLQAGSKDTPVQTPISVTTPLIASIGSAAASAVLPITSPLKSLNEQSSAQTPALAGVLPKSTSSSTMTQKKPVLHAGSQQRTPNHLETNPFDKILFK